MFQVICKRVESSSSWSCSVLFKPLFPQKAFTSHAEKSGIIWQPGHPTNRFKICVSQHKEYGDTYSRRKCQKEKNLASSGKKKTDSKINFKQCLWTLLSSLLTFPTKRWIWLSERVSHSHHCGRKSSNSTPFSKQLKNLSNHE